MPRGPHGIRRSGGSVAEIAAQVGYRNAGKFAAAFKKATGCTPLEYRQEARPET
ncbi:MAG TPA: hypothetical protein DCR92_06060 [Faecalibacterium sp.]|nr:hypothetical protein [Faecalibacterium sp.]